MTDDASLEAAGDEAGGPLPAAPVPEEELPEVPAARRSIFDLRAVTPLSPEERAVRAAAMERSLTFGAEPVRDERGWALEVDFIEANGAAVEPWKHDRRDKRLYKRNQKVTKAAGQLIGQPGDKIEWAKRLAVLHHREGSDIEGAVRRGLFDAIWRYDHVYDGYTVPRRYGTHFMKTGRVAAVAEEQRRKWIAEGRAPADAFWVRNRRNTGLVLVSPNPDPDAPVADEDQFAALQAARLSVQPQAVDDPQAVTSETIFGSQGDDTIAGQGPEDPAAEPELRGDLDIINFVDEHRALESEDFRQRAFEAGLDPDRAVFFRDLLMMTPDSRPELRERARSLFPGFERVSIDHLINQIAREGNSANRKRLIQAEARHARPANPDEEIGLAMVSPVGKGPQRRRGRRRRQGSALSERFVLPRQDRAINWNKTLNAPERRSFSETGTALYSVPNQPVAEWVIRHGRPLGFTTNEAFKTFVDRLHGTVTGLDPKARVAMRGSAVNGLSFDKDNQSFSKTFFDMKIEKASDFDIAIVSPALLRLAGQSKIPVLPRNGGLRTGPIKNPRPLRQVGLLKLQRELTKQAGGRDVSFMIYESLEQLERRGTMMILR